MIECILCGKSFNFISESHLRYKHNITTKQYKSLYPFAKLCSDEWIKKASEQCTLQHKDPNFGFQKGHKINEGLSPWNKGLTADTDARVAKQAETQKGKPKSYEHKQNLSKAKKEFYRQHPDKIPKGEKNGMYGKKLTPEHLQALWTSYQKQTKPEKAAEQVLCQFGFTYTGQRKFWITFKDGTHKNPDFVHKDRKTVVEIYGDYWHKNDDPDVIIQKYAEVGWTCYVFWEHEVYDAVHFNYDSFAQLIDEFEMEDFTYEDWDGTWMQ